MTACPLVELPPSLQDALLAGHPWVYRDGVPSGFSAPDGDWVEVRAGRFVGFGVWDGQGPLAIRIYSRTGVPNREWFDARIRHAIRLRAGLAAEGTTAFRLLNGEGDGLPGIVVDRYGPYAVLVLDAAALESLVPLVIRSIESHVSLKGIVRRRRGEPGLAVLAGRRPPDRLIVEENGLRFATELSRGQKTGQFLDQRDNRRFVGSVAADRSVLNLFGYTGGFSLYAARGGARQTTTVDVSPDAIDAARENFVLNGLDPDQHAFIVADVFDYLGDSGPAASRFGLIVCDPPSLARRREHVRLALRAYTRLNGAGLRRIEEGGFYAASSCSARVGAEDFRATLALAARKARRRIQIVRDSGQGIDHPILVGHPEGRYLKFLVGHVLPD